MLTFYTRGYCEAEAAGFLRLRRSFGGSGSQVVQASPPFCCRLCISPGQNSVRGFSAPHARHVKDWILFDAIRGRWLGGVG